jgi:hypothetical protein
MSLLEERLTPAAKGVEGMTIPIVLAWEEANERLRALDENPFVVGYEPAGTGYHHLLQLGLRFCGYALLVMQPQFEWSGRAREALNILNPWLATDLTGTEWPGTRVYHEARLLIYNYDLEFVKEVQSITRRLFQWEQPDLPEDLCLFRRSGEPWLATISHEHDAWLNLAPHELPAAKGALSPIPLRPPANSE